MKKFFRILLMLLMYVSLFISAFGIISYFTKVEILPNILYQLLIGVAFLVISIVLFIVTFKSEDEEELEDDEVVSDEELLQEAEKVERVEDDNEEYTDDTTVLSTTGIIALAVENAKKEAEESVSRSLQDNQVNEENPQIEEDVNEELQQQVIEEEVQEDAVDSNEIEDELIETTEISIEEIKCNETINEVEQPIDEIEETEQSYDSSEEENNSIEISETQQMYTEIESDLVDAVDRIEGIVVENEIEQESQNNDSQENVAIETESSEELEERLGLSATSMQILNVDSVEVETVSTTELAQIEDEEEIAKDYQPIIDNFMNAVDNMDTAAEQLAIEAAQSLNVEAKTIPDGLTNTQVVYIEESNNSYIDENGIPQLKITNELNANDINRIDEEFKKIEEQAAKRAAEIEKAEEEAIEFENEEKASVITGWLVGIMVVLILAIAGVGFFYLKSRKLI